MRFRTWQLGCALGAFGCLGSNAGAAQEAVADPGDTAAEDAQQLDRVQVTARRKLEYASEIPLAISTLADERLQAMTSAGDDIRILAGRLPSLHVESSFGRSFPRFYLRGFGNADFLFTASQPVSLVYDEVVLENPILKGFPLFDMAQVEVLRGPQGSLFGRNSPAGVIKFESNQPSAESEGYARVGLGSLGTRNFEAAYGGALSESWSGRLAVLGQHRSDWVDNAYTGDDNSLEGHEEYALRGQTLFAASDDFSALLRVHGRRLNASARLFRANIIEPGSNNLVTDFDRDTVYFDGNNRQTLEHVGLSARLNWRFDGFNLHSVTAWDRGEIFSLGDIDGGFGASFAPPFGPGFIPFASESSGEIPDLYQLSQEFRIESNSDALWQWQTGVYAFHDELTIDSYSYNSLANSEIDGFERTYQDNDTWALFATVDRELARDWNLQLGARWTDDHKTLVGERFLSPLAFLGVGPFGPVSVRTDDAQLTWDVSLGWTPTDQQLWFARLAKGFRAPSVQGSVLFSDVVSTVDSETVVSFELGWKTELFDPRLNLGITAYRFEARDQQLTAVGGQINANILLNADRSNGHGLEVELDWQPNEFVQLYWTSSYNHTEIDDADLALFPCGSGCNVLDPPGPVPGTVLIDGNPLPYAPEWIHAVNLRLSHPWGEAGEVYAQTDWAYRSEVEFFLYQSREFVGDPLLEGGLRLGYSWDLGRNDVALFGRNILDEVEAVGGIDFNNFTGMVNEPRIWGVEFYHRF